MKRFLSWILACLMMTAAAVAPAAYATENQPPDVKWVQGPTSVKCDGKADFSLDKGYVYLNKEDTVKMMTYYGNPTTEIEMGSVFPADENQSWFVIFEYHDAGHVDDKDKEKINADDLLQSLKDGTAEGNKIRKEKGMPEIQIEGWAAKPAYNEALHSLAWGTLYSSDGDKGINYECKILSRTGYVSATLVCSVEEFERCKGELVKIVNNFKFVSGERYADYVPGKDKLSELGLAALIVGGTAAAVKKGGLIILLIALLKKGGILLLAPFAYFAKKFRRKKDADIFPEEGFNETIPASEAAHASSEAEPVVGEAEMNAEVQIADKAEITGSSDK